MHEKEAENQNIPSNEVQITSENNDQNNHQNTPFFDAYLEHEIKEGKIDRNKSSLRMQYEAEKAIIINKIGDLEKVRSLLGLSKRKICQLLLVDPSAWTRWNKDPEKVPPHVYRSLEWYLALRNKYPMMSESYWLSFTRGGAQSGLRPSEGSLEELKNSLLKELNHRLDANMMWVTADLKKRTKSLPWKEAGLFAMGLSLGLVLSKILFF